MKNNGSEVKRGGSTVPSKQKIYAKIAMRSNELVDNLFELTRSKNENIRLGALKLLVNKILPDSKVSEFPIIEKSIEVNMPNVERWLKGKLEEMKKEES